MVLINYVPNLENINKLKIRITKYNSVCYTEQRIVPAMLLLRVLGPTTQ